MLSDLVLITSQRSTLLDVDAASVLRDVRTTPCKASRHHSPNTPSCTSGHDGWGASEREEEGVTFPEQGVTFPEEGVTVSEEGVTFLPEEGATVPEERVTFLPQEGAMPLGMVSGVLFGPRASGRFYGLSLPHP